jgi:hypothetical protein
MMAFTLTISYKNLSKFNLSKQLEKMVKVITNYWQISESAKTLTSSSSNSTNTRLLTDFAPSSLTKAY